MMNRTQAQAGSAGTPRSPRRCAAPAWATGSGVGLAVPVPAVDAAGLAAVAGVMVSANYGIAHYHMGFLLGLKAFTAAVLGEEFGIAVRNGRAVDISDTAATIRHSQLLRKYLVVYLLAALSDWLQGPYVYALYDAYGYSQHDIAVLFVAGFGSSMVFGSFVGGMADQ